MKMKIVRYVIAYLWKKYRFLFVDVLNDEGRHVHRNPKPIPKKVQEAFDTLQEASEEELDALNVYQKVGE